MSAIHTGKEDQLQYKVYKTRAELGAEAAREAIEQIKKLQAEQKKLRMVFAAAPSQNEFLAALVAEEGIDWPQITAFHMDEYIGLPRGASQSFGTFLRERLFDKVRPGEVHYINGEADPAEECARYSRLLAEEPIDIVCLGIGENGHIAFNDPPVADFNDPHLVKEVELEDACRKQQVNDGCFPDLAAVPTKAITLTIPALLSAKSMFCMVPGPTKTEAVRRTLQEPVSTECPSTILKTHPNCILYLDEASYGGL